MNLMWTFRYAPAVLSALAVPLSLPNELAPMGNPLLGPLAIAPLLLSLYRCESYAQAARSAMLFTTISTVLTYYWLAKFQGFSLWTLGGTIVGYAVFGAILGPILRGVAIAASQFRPYAVACAWVVYEYLRSSGFLGFPWGLVAYPVQGITPLIQFTSLTGIWGLSLLIALSNAVVAEGATRAWRQQPVRAYLLVVILSSVAMGHGLIRLGITPISESRTENETVIEVALIQHNRNPWEDGDDEGSIRTLMELTRQELNRGEVDLIVWSETALRHPPIGEHAKIFESIPKEDPLANFMRSLNAHLITGSPYPPADDQGRWSNASIIFGPHATWSDHYRKQQLVPFAERVPFYEVDFIRRFYHSIVGIGGGWSPGSKSTVFSIRTRDGRDLRLSTPICFEDAFPGLNRRFVRAGAELLINLTNDSWSETLSAETQHLVAARFRSVENARPLLRATNGGITVGFDQYGRVLPESVLPPFEAATTRVTLRLPLDPITTPYTRYGEYLPLTLIITLLFLLGRHAASSGRQKQSRNNLLRTTLIDSDL